MNNKTRKKVTKTKNNNKQIVNKRIKLMRICDLYK